MKPLSMVGLKIELFENTLVYYETSEVSGMVGKYGYYSFIHRYRRDTGSYWSR